MTFEEDLFNSASMKKLYITREITRKDSIATRLYLKDIHKFEPLSTEEEVELIKKIRQGDEEAKVRLIFSNLRFVVTIAKKYQSLGMGLADLISEGNFGLLEAAHKFDETKGFKFITYAVWWIRQSISRSITEKSQMIRVPSGKVWTNSKIQKASSKFEQENHRKPSIEETARELNIEEHEVETALINNRKNLSIEDSLDSYSDYKLYDVLEDTSLPRPDDGLIRESLQIELDELLNQIPKKEAEVIRNYFGLNGNHECSTFSISRKFNISEERVRQLKELGLKRLKSVYYSQNPAKYLA